MVRGAWCIAAALLCACDPKAVAVSVNVVSAACDPTLDPFEGVNLIELRVSGPGIDPTLVVQKERAIGTVEIPQIPAGPGRVIEVRGLAENSAARPISIGRSVPFDIPDVLTDRNRNIDINIFMRKVDSFTPPGSAASPRDCARLRLARAGHAATVLKDGRVFISGGYRLDQNQNRVAMDDTEFFDPNKGSFEDGPRMTLSAGTQIPKAFHTATALPNGQVLLYGGERYTASNNTPQPSSIVIVFDVEKNGYGAVPSRTSPANIPRSKHLALLDGFGNVLIVGGYRGSSLSAVNEVEYYDTAIARVKVVDGQTLPRTEASGSVVQDGGVVIVAGGVDADGGLSDDVNFFRFDGTSYVKAGVTQHLRTARRGATAMTLSDDTTMLLMGGYRDATQMIAEPSSEAIKTSTNTVEQPTATIGDRGDACTALLQQGNLLVVGGRKTGGSADNGATLMRYDSTKGSLTAAAASPLKVARYFHTCTTMADGSVLITGGMADATTVLQDAWIYTPIPGD